MTDHPIYVLVGLTASGKKNVGIQVAEFLDAEVVSLDSMKIYRGMDIGSAKPSPADRARIPFHMLDIIDPQGSFSVGRFLSLARDVVEGIRARSRKVLFLGGTAFYLNCLVNGLIENIEEDLEARDKLMARVEKEGPDVLHSELNEIDPESSQLIHPNDTKRIVRALEVFVSTGHTLSWLKKHRTRRVISGPFRIAGLKWPNENLRDRIARRTEKMIKKGLVEEVREIMDGSGFGTESGRAIGYLQIIKHLDGEMSLDEAVEAINTATWRLARKQMTWYKRFEQIKWFEPAKTADEQDTARAVAAYFSGGDEVA